MPKARGKYDSELTERFNVWYESQTTDRAETVVNFATVIPTGPAHSGQRRHSLFPVPLRVRWR